MNRKVGGGNLLDGNLCSRTGSSSVKCLWRFNQTEDLCLIIVLYFSYLFLFYFLYNWQIFYIYVCFFPKYPFFLMFFMLFAKGQLFFYGIPFIIINFYYYFYQIVYFYVFFCFCCYILIEKKTFSCRDNKNKNWNKKKKLIIKNNHKQII